MVCVLLDPVLVRSYGSFLGYMRLRVSADDSHHLGEAVCALNRAPRRVAEAFTLKKLECSKQATCSPEYISME